MKRYGWFAGLLLLAALGLGCGGKRCVAPAPMRPYYPVVYSLEARSTNGWIAFREIQFVDSRGERVKPAAVSGSAWHEGWSDFGPGFAFDGKPETYWNLGDYTATATFYFQEPVKIARMRFMPVDDTGTFRAAYTIKDKDGKVVVHLADYQKTTRDVDGSPSEWIDLGIGVELLESRSFRVQDEVDRTYNLWLSRPRKK